MIRLILINCILMSMVLNIMGQSKIHIVSQSTGPFLVNSYLIYDSISNESAIIDAGSSIDSLIKVIEQKNLKLCYIFLTHAHQDHIIGLNKLRVSFPSAKVGFTTQEFNNIAYYKKWREVFTKEDVDSWQNDSSICHLMDFDYNSIYKPDIFLDDNQSFDLGNHKIDVIYTPGHSTGSVTISIDNYIFSGDLILYNSTGNLDYALCSEKDIFASVQKLYKRFPDETIIYSGHGKPSTIGFEKKNNKEVRIQ